MRGSLLKAVPMRIIATVIAAAVCCACGPSPAPPPPAASITLASGELDIALAQRLVAEHFVDVTLTVTGVQQESGSARAAARAGSYVDVDVELERDDGGWRVARLLHDGRPVEEPVPGLVSTSLIISMQVLRGRNTLAGMRLIAQALERMHGETGAYPSSLQELVDLGYLDPIRLDAIVMQGTEVVRMREQHGELPHLRVGRLIDAWGMPWVYETAGSSYTLLSTGSDGGLGPAPGYSSGLRGESDVDLVMVDGVVVQPAESQ